ncbi:hypothetical protein D9757_010310 [Collybiopsis confluens]|uniref:Uncharacterized protein n=1 Tax=Collybiopsis confluens TaxID=2823264 RepID=A0A8H5GUA5_9AGAR|nr:hypothetical protein D9757_010310 [Collybiopsis confluens]
MSDPIKIYKNARISLLEHTALIPLVVQDEIPIVKWAKNFALNKHRYEEMRKILLRGGFLAEDVRGHAKQALITGDEFLLANAESSWEGTWVDPRWTRSAEKREKTGFRGRKRSHLEKEIDSLFDKELEEIDFGYESTSSVETIEMTTAASVSRMPSRVPAPAKSYPRKSAIPSGWLTHRKVEDEGDSDNNGDDGDNVRRFSSSSRKIMLDLSRPRDNTIKRGPEKIEDDDNEDGDHVYVEESRKRKRKGHVTLVSPKNSGKARLSCSGRLPFDFRALSREAQTALLSGKPPVIDNSLPGITRILKKAFEPYQSLIVNEPFVREMSKVLPACENCKSGKKCTWIQNKATCEACQTIGKRCQYGDTLKWLKDLSRLKAVKETASSGQIHFGMKTFENLLALSIISEIV